MTRARLGDDSGFTLVELLAAMIVGMIVMFAIFGLLDTAVRLQAKSVDGLETTDRGRLGIDQISQGFASRICVGDVSSLVEAADDHVEFYASLAPESSAVRLIVQRRRVALSGTSIREDVWTSSPPLAAPNLPPANTTPPARTRVIVAGVHATGSTPIFRFYARNGVTTLPTVPLPTPLSSSDLRRAVLVDVTFTAQGKRGDISTDYNNQVLDRSSACI
ncbi:MAG TPA: prepilin-type N-terminal cleavage/methylation domain-containing protein [Solirubrobacteraceae bacterium]|nr:prepilin-type N-terminal cleavage/methylation domain-containing protein [Solirubrobacteraceae bacterium]